MPRLSPQVTQDAAALVRLSVPLALGHLGTHVMGLVDIAVVGRFSENALAAVGLGNSIFFGIAILGMGVMFGLDPIISQAVGARQDREADSTFWQGLWLALLLSVPIIALLGIANWFLRLSPIDSTVVTQAIDYIHARMLSVLPFYIFIGARSFLQSYDVTRPFLIAVVIANIINVPLTISLVFGDEALLAIGFAALGLPPLGALGAGMATFVAALIQMVILTVSVFMRRPSVAHAERKPDRTAMVRALRIGIPIALTLFAEVGFFAMTGILAGWLGATALAAHNVALNLSGTTFQVAIALGTAASVRVGQAVGAQDTPRARRAGFIALALGLAWMSLGAVTFVAFPSELARWITDEQSVIIAVAPLMLAAAAFQLVDGAQAVMNGSLRGAGDTRFAFWANVAGHYLLGLPFALVTAFYFDWGTRGLWWGLCVGLAAVAVILTTRFWHLSSKPIART